MKVLFRESAVLTRSILGALYLMCGFFMFALHADTLDAPTLVYQEYKENFIVRHLPAGKKLQRKQIERVRVYLLSHMRDVTAPKVERLSRLIVRLSVKYGIDADLILTIIKVESNFRPWAVSPRGALGLMQLMPETGEWIARRCGMEWVGPATLLDEEKNLEMGVNYLHWLKERYSGNLKNMLSAYNQGPGKVDEEVSEGRNPTLDYYHKVKEYLPKFALNSSVSDKQKQD